MSEEGAGSMESRAAGTEIPESELRFITSRSGGPGGQNVNKVETRVTLQFSVEDSPSLDDDQKRKLRERLRSRISRSGLLQVSSQKYRSQRENREAAIARFQQLLADALAEEPPRKKTRVPKGAKRKRLEEKKRRSEIKRERSQPIRDL